MICLIVVCITTKSATIFSSSVFVVLQLYFLLPTRSSRLVVATGVQSLIIEASIVIHRAVALAVFAIVVIVIVVHPAITVVVVIAVHHNIVL